MPREVVKKAGVAALETTLRAGMPRLEEAIAGLQQIVLLLRDDMKQLRDEVQKEMKQLRDEVQKEMKQLRDEVQRDMKQLREEMHNEVRNLDAKVDALRDEMLNKFEQHRDLVNEVSHSVTRLDGKLEGFTEAMGVRLMDKPRKRRAG